MKPFKHFSGVVGLLLLIALPGCNSCQKKKDHEALGSEQEVKGEEATGEFAATVNGTGIKRSELDNMSKRAQEQFAKTGRPTSPQIDKNIRGSILRKMIDDEIFRQKAAKEDVKVDRIERVEALEKYKERMGGQKSFELVLKQQNLTEDQIMETVVADLQRDKLIGKLQAIPEPTEEEIKKHYEANKGFYTQPEKVRVRHILLKLADNEPQEKAALVLKKANEVLKEAQKGGSFEALVQKYSEGPSTAQGGDIGFFGRGQMDKPFEDAAFNAPLKTPVGPVKTAFGYHILYVEEKTPSKPAELAEVRDRAVELIKRNKRSVASEDLLQTWRKEAKISISDSSMTYEEYIELYDRAEAKKTAKKDE